MKYVLLLLAVLLAGCTVVPLECSGEADRYDTDTCILNLAFATNESSYCDAIKNDAWETWCYTDIAKNTLDVELCNEIDKGSSQDNCVKNIALATTNASLCASIIGSASGDNCYATLGQQQQNEDFCALVKTIEQKNKCFVTVAEAKGKYSLCSLVQKDIRRMDACLFRVTLQTNQTQGCADIFEPETENICYVNHAIKFLDSSICEDILDTKMKSSCRSAVKLASAKV